jgi:surface protein
MSSLSFHRRSPNNANNQDQNMYYDPDTQQVYYLSDEEENKGQHGYDADIFDEEYLHTIIRDFDKQMLSYEFGNQDAQDATTFTKTRSNMLQYWKSMHSTPKQHFDAILYHYYAIPVELRVMIHSYVSIALDNVTILDAVNLWGYGTVANSRRHLSPFAVSRMCNIKDIIIHCGHPSDWNTSNVTSMTRLFATWSTFNEDINNWDVSNVTDMSSMFAEVTEFNQPLDKWEVKKVRNMSKMFRGATIFNQPLEQWNVANVEEMSQMFEEAITFNQPLNHWDVQKVRQMASMFEHAVAFNQPLNGWKIKLVKDMSKMFFGATSFIQPLNRWDMRKVMKLDAMFDDKYIFQGHLQAWKIK